MPNAMDEFSENTNIYKPEPPRDMVAERAVLGSIIINSPDAISDVIDKLKPENFYLKEHQVIYNAFIEMYKRSIEIDLVTTTSQLNKEKSLEMVGGQTYLNKLCDEAILPSNVKYYAEAVIDKSHMRQLIAEAERIRESAYDGQKSPTEILDFAEQRIYDIAHRNQRRDYVDINEVLLQNIADIQELENNKGQLPGITTGFVDLDDKLGGLHKTDMIIVAARPGMGKTSFALNIAQNAADAGNSVIIFSMEMSKEQLGERMLAMAARVDMDHIKKGALSRSEWESLSEAQDDFEGKKIVIDEATDISVLEMKNKCRRLKAERGLDLVIIDYLQLMSLGYGVENREKEISAITRSVKLMAKELDCAVLLLSQLSRNTEKRNSHRPQLSDLRDSGAIEQDADIVIFLRREEYYDDDEGEPIPQGGGDCEVNIAKHRNGPTGAVHLAWIARYTKFDNLARGAEF